MSRWRTIALAALAIAPGGAERDWHSVTRETLDTWRSPSCQALIAQSLTARDQPCGKRARSAINAWCNATSTGFLKNPKADSKGVRDHVEAQCASGVLPADKMDVVMIRPVENRTRFFTTVREPVARMMSAYGEVDAKCEGLKRGSDDCKGTRFWALPRRFREPLRFLAFLDDYERHRIPKSVQPQHASPQWKYVCDITDIALAAIFPLESKDRVAAIEALVRGDPRRRSLAGYGDVKSVDRMALNEVSVSGEGARGRLLHVARAHICRMFYADFVCFGYPIPEECAAQKTSADALTSAVDEAMRAPEDVRWKRVRRKRARDKSATASS